MRRFPVWQKARAVSNPVLHNEFLDACAWQCPMPLLKTKLKLAAMQAGEVLLVHACDAGTWQDLPRYIQHSAHELIAAHEVDGQYHFLIRKGA
jgi:tRNA 2-thiouridine synthesizing protein A